MAEELGQELGREGRGAVNWESVGGGRRRIVGCGGLGVESVGEALRPEGTRA